MPLNTRVNLCFPIGKGLGNKKMAVSFFTLEIFLPRVCSNDPSLTTLNLSSQIGDSGAGALATALQHNTTLLFLNLPHNNICDSGLSALPTALQHNSTLISLNLSFNKICQSGASALGTALQTNSTLTTLYLHSNNIDDSGANALATTLQHNSTLGALSLSYNNIGEWGWRALAIALQTNSALTHLDIFNQHDSPHYPLLQRNLSNSVKKSSSLYELLLSILH